MAKKNNTNNTDPEFEKFLAQMKIVGFTESENNYRAKNPNPDSTATGKYQYTKAHLKNIIPLSKKMGTPISTMEEFRNSEAIQEAYFRQNMKDVYKWAKERINSKNPFNYNLAQLGVLAHFQGQSGADKILTTGKHKPADDLGNPSTKEYIEERFTPALKDAGLYVYAGKEKNLLRANNKNVVSMDERLKIQDEYFKSLKNIKDQGLDPQIQNMMITELNQKYFDEGNLEIVNRKIDYRNNQRKEKVKEKFDELKIYKEDFKSLGPYRFEKSNKDKQRSWNDADMIGEAFGENINEIVSQQKNHFSILDYDYEIDENSKTGQFLKSPNIDLVEQITPGEYLKNIDLTQYERITPDEVVPENPEQITKDSNESNASTALLNPDLVSADPESETPKGYNTEEIQSFLSSPELFQDEQFTYNKGKFNFPIEAAGNIAMALKGMDAANVDMPERNEEIGVGLRNYAAQLSRIKDMGLSPEQEADYKQKLASSYQTGLTNIVRASNGNRNLVLGNQGQLDAARMKGISDMAIADVERRDRAMEAYGEVIGQIDKFYANRNIANNERKYREAEREQAAGSLLAQQGFSSLIDSIQYAKENGPGSANDMYKQYLMYSITGINPGIDDDGSGNIPGTSSYIEKQSQINSEKNNQKKSISKYFNSLSNEEQERFGLFLKENKKFRPDLNPDINFEDVKNSFENYSGKSEAKSNLLIEQGVMPENVITLNENQLQENNTSIEPMPLLSAYSNTEMPNNNQPYNGDILNNREPYREVNSQNDLIKRLEQLNMNAEEQLSKSNQTNLLLDDMTNSTVKSTEEMKSKIKSTY